MLIRKEYSLGIVLILIGIVIFVLNIDIIPNDVLWVAIGVGFIIGFCFNKHTSYLILGMIFLGRGITLLINEYTITSVGLWGVAFIGSIGIGFLILYFIKKAKGLIYPGSILSALAIFSLFDDIYDAEIGWLFFLLLALAFYTIYFLESRKRGSSLALVTGNVLIIVSGFVFLTSKNVFGTSLWRALSFIWPVILILIGVRIIYNKLKN